jgi:hypothetical protein
VELGRLLGSLDEPTLQSSGMGFELAVEGRRLLAGFHFYSDIKLARGLSAKDAMLWAERRRNRGRRAVRMGSWR